MEMKTILKGEKYIHKIRDTQHFEEIKKKKIYI